MGDYLELVLGVHLRLDERALRNLRWLLLDESEPGDVAPFPDEHPLWRQEHARGGLSGGGLATRGRAPRLTELADYYNEDLPPGPPEGEMHELFVWTSIKRFVWTVQLLDWLGEHIVEPRERVIGWSVWEGSDPISPVVLMWDPEARAIRERPIQP
ncbi:MAG TPA: hypothetical protein VM370_09520 [Candidatus Thermoplasmatota archaeon]|nr:hypothetical protein [Candidatus Thermoplasmatota archaeon]